jgi:predicted metal-dependent hydrolase
MGSNEWSPIYTLRKSRKARQISLHISVQHGLVIVIPEKTRHFNIQEILIEKRGWIDKNLPQIQSVRAQRAEEPVLPSSLCLHAIQKTMMLEYIKTDNTHVKIKKVHPVHSSHGAFETFNGSLTQSNSALISMHSLDKEYYQVVGPIEQNDLVIKLLHRFLTLTARLHLIPWLQRLSNETGLFFSDVSLRRQSTLWGSCSAARKISLNTKLLFLPSLLAQYVLLHELCHIEHLNHSKQYWDLLKQFDPNCLNHRKALRTAAQYIPAWIEG